MDAWRLTSSIGWARFGSGVVVAVLLILGLGLPSGGQAEAQRSPREATQLEAISLPGTKILALGFYEAGDRLFVTDDNSGNLLTLDATTRQVLRTVPVGSSALDLVVNDTYGKVYVASDKNTCCPGTFHDGTGLITVVDATSGQVLRTIDPAPGSPFFPQSRTRFFLLSDPVRNLVYVSYGDFDHHFGVIDVATDSFVELPSVASAALLYEYGAVNPITGEAIFIAGGFSKLAIVNGNDLRFQELPLEPSGGRGPLDVAVNEIENKVYVSMLFPPNQAEIAILIIDRDAGSFRYIGRDDLEPFGYNRLTNRLFSAVQVGLRGAIVEGATDAFTTFEVRQNNSSGGIGAVGVRRASDQAYFVRQTDTMVVSGERKAVIQNFTSGVSLAGGIEVPLIAIDQRAGRVFVSNFQDAGRIMVLQDGGGRSQTAALTVGVAGTGAGSVVGPGIRCGADCSESFALGEVVGLRAEPDAGSLFDGWSGACSGRGACAVALDVAQSVTASFSRPRTRGAAERVRLTVTPVAGSFPVTAGVRAEVTPGCGTLREIRFGANSSNARVELSNRASGLEGAYTWRSPEPTGTVLTVRRKDTQSSATSPFIVPLTVVDDCGEWPTFVGGGSRVT